MDQPSGTEQKILEAALRLLNEQSADKVSVRRIAAEAGVNSAAINYYFRSKEELILKVMDPCTQRLMVVQEKPVSPESLRDTATKMLEESLENPGLVANVFSLAGNGSDNRISEHIHQMFKGMVELFKSNLPLSEEEICLRLFQIVCCLFFPAFVRDQMSDLYGLNLENPQTREQYINRLLTSFMGING